MIQPFERSQSSEPPTTDSVPGRGLADPRTVHPSPEGVFPDAKESTETDQPADPDPQPAPARNGVEDEGRGMVDPRHDVLGPDL
jgi:hypothetical protein